ncbi:MAG: DUF3099 domain-containing protein [Streptosporangiaceae bacterium]
MRKGRRDEDSYTITDARSPLSRDIAHRQRRYLITMGIRTAGLLVAVLVPIPLPAKIAAMAAAIVLPYFAVVIANGGREPERKARFGTPDQERRDPRGLGSGHHEVGR